MVRLDEGFYKIAQSTGDFPPAFGDSTLVYGAVLFMLIAVSAIAMQVFLEEADRYYRSDICRRSSLGIHCRLNMKLMASFILSVAPDGVILLAWGEVTAEHIGLIAIADRILDFVAGWMFLRWWWLRQRSFDIIGTQLGADIGAKMYWLTAERLKNKLVVLSMCLILALGVAVAK